MTPFSALRRAALLGLLALAACSGVGNAPPLENFDPSTVRMLPDNPYLAPPRQAALPRAGG
jgi:hypothetical protein